MSDVLQMLTAYLAQPIDATTTTITVKNFKTSRGVAVTAMIGTLLYATIEPTSQNNQEIISFTGITNLGNGLVQLTGVTRNLGPVPPHTALTADVPHGNGAALIITDTPQFWNERTAKNKTEIITSVWEFTGRPFLTTDIDATDDRQLITRGQLNRTAFGTPTISGLALPSTAGENLTIRQVAWLDETVGTWKLANASTLAEINGTKKLGIVKSTTTSGNVITSGIQPEGYVSGYSGLTVGLVYVNDAGNISNTVGTNSRPAGVAISATEIIFDPNITTQLSASEKAAAAGTSGTPSGSNKFVTDADTATTSAASKVVRTNASGKIDSSFIQVFGGTGTDGALTVAAGNTNIDLGGAKFFIKNYSSISITGSGKITFINPHATGTVILIKSSGDVTLTSSQTPMIDASLLGTAGATGITANSPGGVNIAGVNATEGISLNLKTFAAIAPSTTSTYVGVTNTSLFFNSTLGYYQDFFKYLNVPIAGGGASGNITVVAAAGNAATQGSGGRGGGTLIIECGGSWNFTTANGISVAGSNGTTGIGGNSNTSYPNAGGGGGGAGGYFLGLYNVLVANTGTVNVTAGIGGNSDSFASLNNRAGGYGGALFSLGNSGGSSGTTSAKTGGDGETGVAIIQKNVVYL